jgi:hypothetical protein
MFISPVSPKACNWKIYNYANRSPSAVNEVEKLGNEKDKYLEATFRAESQSGQKQEYLELWLHQEVKKASKEGAKRWGSFCGSAADAV